MNDIILNKAGIIERCLQRIREEYVGFEETFKTNYTKQDSVILNIQRACETAIDMAAHIIRIKSLGIPQTSRDVFVLLESAGIISTEISVKLQAMVGFRNIAIHNYTQLNLTIVQSIIENELDVFRKFNQCVLHKAL